jgi:hypothetical protein
LPVAVLCAYGAPGRTWGFLASCNIAGWKCCCDVVVMVVAWAHRRVLPLLCHLLEQHTTCVFCQR